MMTQPRFEPRISLSATRWGNRLAAEAKIMWSVMFFLYRALWYIYVMLTNKMRTF